MKQGAPRTCTPSSASLPEAVVLQQAAVGQSEDMTGAKYATLRNWSGPKFAADNKAV